MMREQKVTLGEMRSDNGPRRLIVYCSDFKCSHSVVVDAAPWGDNVRLSDLEPRFTCKACAAPMFGPCSRKRRWAPEPSSPKQSDHHQRGGKRA